MKTVKIFPWCLITDQHRAACSKGFINGMPEVFTFCRQDKKMMLLKKGDKIFVCYCTHTADRDICRESADSIPAFIPVRFIFNRPCNSKFNSSFYIFQQGHQEQQVFYCYNTTCE